MIAYGLELDDTRARDEGRIDLEEGVFGRRADKDDDAILDSMEQGILLRAGETVYLVDEQNGAPLVGEQTLLGRLDLAAQVGDGSRNRRDLDEGGVRGIGDDVRDGGLARTRRPEEDDRGERIVGNGAPEPGILADGLFLTDHLAERARAHAHGKWSGRKARLAIHLAEERVHRSIHGSMIPQPHVPAAPCGHADAYSSISRTSDTGQWSLPYTSDSMPAATTESASAVLTRK